MSAADRRYGSRGRTRTFNLPDLVVASRRRCPCSSTQVTGMAGRRDTCLDVRGRAPVATRVATRRVLRRRLGSSRTTPQTDARVSVLRSIVAALHRRVPAPRASVRRRRPDPDGRAGHAPAARSVRSSRLAGTASGRRSRGQVSPRRGAQRPLRRPRHDPTARTTPRPPRCRHRGRPHADEQLLAGPGSRLASASRDVDEPSAGHPGPVRQTGSNVRLRQRGVISQNVLDGRPVGKQSEHETHPDPRTPNRRLAEAHGRVGDHPPQQFVLSRCHAHIVGARATTSGGTEQRLTDTDRPAETSIHYAELCEPAFRSTHYKRPCARVRSRSGSCLLRRSGSLRVEP